MNMSEYLKPEDLISGMYVKNDKRGSKVRFKILKVYLESESFDFMRVVDEQGDIIPDPEIDNLSFDKLSKTLLEAKDVEEIKIADVDRLFDFIKSKS